jgi:hypothetical protein
MPHFLERSVRTRQVVSGPNQIRRQSQLRLVRVELPCGKKRRGDQIVDAQRALETTELDIE